MRGARDPSDRAWSVRRLTILRECLEKRLSFTDCAARTGRSKEDCDLAAWTMLGRPLEEAAAILNGVQP